MKIDSGTVLTAISSTQHNRVNAADNVARQDGLQLAKENTVQKSEDVNKKDSEEERFLQLDIADAVNDIEEYTKLKEVGLQLKIDRDSDNAVIVELIDKENNEVIRQIPSEEAVELAKHLKKVFDSIDKNRKEIAGSFVNDIV